MAIKPLAEKSVWGMIKNLLNSSVILICDAGSPTNGTSGTGVTFAGIGSIYIDTTAGNAYMNTGTKASPTWTSFGSVINPSNITLAQGNIIIGSAGGVGAALSGKTSGQILIGNGTTMVSVAVSGDVTIAATGAVTIAANAVTNAKLAGMTRGTVKTGNSSGAAADLAASTSGAVLMGNGTDVVSQGLTGDVVLSGAGLATIQAGVVTGSKIAAATVAGSNMVNNTVTSTQLDVTTLQTASGTISSPNITGTSAGQLGNAQGVVLVSAPGAGKVLQLDSAVIMYTFATAAYTGGGNITVNTGGGGAAQTGLISYANSVGKGSSTTIVFYPLTTAGVALTSNTGLNLVAASAPTQPGTAAGTIAWQVWYTVLSPGF